MLGLICNMSRITQIQEKARGFLSLQSRAEKSDTCISFSSSSGCTVIALQIVDVKDAFVFNVHIHSLWVFIHDVDLRVFQATGKGRQRLRRYDRIIRCRTHEVQAENSQYQY